MGRWLGLFIAAGLSAFGCAAPPASRLAPATQTWERLCARLGPFTRSAGQSPALPPLSTTARAACERVARDAAAAVVHVRTTIAGRTATTAAPAGEAPAHLSTGGPQTSGGTGVIIDETGLVVTCAHVVLDAATIAVVLPDGTHYPVSGLAIDADTDVALIKIAADHLPALSPAADPPSLGTAVVALGRPRPHDIAARPGLVTCDSTSLQEQLDPARRRDYSDLLESSTPLDPGFSGGPLLDAAGRLIGLNVASAGATTAHPRGLALRFDERLHGVLQRLRQSLRAARDD